MTMLTPTHGSLERHFRSLRAQNSSAARSAAAHLATTACLATIKRFCMRVLVGMAVGAALAAIIALKAVLFLGLVHYY